MSTGDLFGDRIADFSSCRKYRYTLWQWWDKKKPYVMFIGLNPSTADEVQDDPTVRRCIRFAQRWGYGGFCMTNLFAFRATDPKEMKAQEEPIGPLNDEWLVEIAQGAGIVVAAWGVHGVHMNRENRVINILEDLCCLGITKEGHPRHPLYMKNDTKLMKYRREEE